MHAATERAGPRGFIDFREGNSEVGAHWTCAGSVSRRLAAEDTGSWPPRARRQSRFAGGFGGPYQCAAWVRETCSHVFWARDLNGGSVHACRKKVSVAFMVCKMLGNGGGPSWLVSQHAPFLNSNTGTTATELVLYEIVSLFSPNECSPCLNDFSAQNLERNTNLGWYLADPPFPEALDLKRGIAHDQFQ